MEEADAAAKSGMSTQVMGTKVHRWSVIEHAGRYYAFDAQQDLANTAPKLPAANGTLSAWHALRFVDNGSGDSTWVSYDFARGAGTFNAFADTGAPAAAGTGASAATTSATPVAGAPAPAPGASSPVAGGGPTAAAPTAAPASLGASLVGQGFQVNDASYDGRKAAGGWVQLQRLVPGSEVGYATAEDAASAARLARVAVQPGEWDRWVTVRGADGRFYAFEGQIVSRSTGELSAGASPAHVFGSGFAEYYDGAGWQAARDTAYA
jgi:hypothetical protein